MKEITSPKIQNKNVTDTEILSASKEMKNHDKLNCQAEHQTGHIEPKEFFIFKTGIVWCNVFKSASTSVLYIMGLLDGMSEKKLQKTLKSKVHFPLEKHKIKVILS